MLEVIAVVLGLLYLLLAVYQQRACWIAGGLASLIFLAIFQQAGLPMQALLQAYYVAVAIHGWRHWGAAGEDDAPTVGYWPASRHLIALGGLACLVFASVVVRDALGDVTATLDALTSWGSVLATWLVAQKKREAWLYWIVIDALSALLYLQTELMATAALYLLYTALAVLGWYQWKTSSPAPSNS